MANPDSFSPKTSGSDSCLLPISKHANIGSFFFRCLRCLNQTPQSASLRRFAVFCPKPNAANAALTDARSTPAPLPRTELKSTAVHQAEKKASKSLPHLQDIQLSRLIRNMDGNCPLPWPALIPNVALDAASATAPAPLGPFQDCPSIFLPSSNPLARAAVCACARALSTRLK